MPQPDVTVLLSTYNGASYLCEQLDSLYQQRDIDFHLLIRDDGSRDATLDILKQYAQRHNNLQLLVGDNLGATQSFLALVHASAAQPSRYFAFCDQDDVWLPHKLSHAVAQLAALPDAAASLYCSRLAITDHHLKPLRWSAVPCVGFENALVENAAIGCTQVFGTAIRERLLRGDPTQMMMHDWWVYLLATAFGQVIYDPEPTLYYRQHAANAVGWDKRPAKMLQKAGYFLDNLLVKRRGLQCLTQAEHFLHTYPELSPDKRKLLQTLLQLRHNGSFWQRLRFLQQQSLHRTNTVENVILKLTVLSGLH